MPHVHLVLKLAVVGLVAAVPATALFAEVATPINDVRFGLTIQQSPTISEAISGPGSGTKNYHWEDAKIWGLRYDLMYYQGLSRRGRPLPGFLWEAGLSYGRTDITPGAYDVGTGSNYPNSRQDITLKYTQYGASLGAGWGTMPSTTSVGNLHWEALALARGGFAQAETVSPGLNATRNQGGSTFWEAGPQVGLVVCDEGWVFGLHLGWLYGRALTNINLPDGYQSQLSIIRNGLELGAELGGRF